jgi:hypothetical protein
VVGATKLALIRQVLDPLSLVSRRQHQSTRPFPVLSCARGRRSGCTETELPRQGLPPLSTSTRSSRSPAARHFATASRATRPCSMPDGHGGPHVFFRVAAAAATVLRLSPTLLVSAADLPVQRPRASPFRQQCSVASRRHRSDTGERWRSNSGW